MVWTAGLLPPLWLLAPPLVVSAQAHIALHGSFLGSQLGFHKNVILTLALRNEAIFALRRQRFPWGSVI
jgi:hypothetical protein